MGTLRCYFTGLAVFITLSLSVQTNSNAENQDFLVKQATYSGTGGAFRCVAELGAGDDATLSLTVPAAQADDLVKTVHANVSAKITRTVTGVNETILIAVSSPTKATVEVAYQTQFVLADAYHVRYHLDQKLGRLKGFLHVNDRSLSTSAWSDTALLLKRPMGDLKLELDMITGGGAMAPIKELKNYPVKWSNPDPKILRTNGTRAYYVQELFNSGNEVLQKGVVTVTEGRTFLYSSELKSDVASVKPAKLQGTPVPSSEVAVSKTAAYPDRWHEAVSIVDGILTYKPWPVTETIVENKTADILTIYIGDSKDSNVLGANSESRIVIPTGPAKPETTTDLFDLTKDKLTEHTSNLGHIAKFSSSAKLQKDLPVNIPKIWELHKLILKATVSIEALEATKVAVNKQIAALTAAGQDPAVISRLLARLTRVNQQLTSNKTDLASETANLIPLLFPAP